MDRTNSKSEKGPKRGPKPEILKIQGDWRDAMGKALKKKPPMKDWPKPKKNKK